MYGAQVAAYCPHNGQVHFHPAFGSELEAFVTNAAGTR